MCKTIKKIYNEKITMEKLLEAHIRAKIGKGLKLEILKFEMDLESNIINIYNELKRENYTSGKYRIFKVYEPKERVIKALPYKDRIIHQWYIKEIIKPYFMPRFIETSYACIDNRGTHKAVLKIQKYMRKMKKQYGCYYVIKCDIAKFFYSIDREVLFNIMKKHIKDKQLLNLTYKIIFDNDDMVGIPIGNYTSQYFANIYLNELDYYIKHDLKVNFYVRYMDDFILLIKNKSEAKRILNEINIFIVNNLKLNLNNKTKYYKNNLGIDFCGYIIYETHIKVRKRSIKKMYKKIRNWNNEYSKNELDYNSFLLSFNSFKSHIKHANSYNLLNKICSKIEFYNR